MSNKKRPPLLARQIRKNLPGVDLAQKPWCDFIETVNDSYGQADQERELGERTLDAVSEDLTEANEQIRRDAENQLNQLTKNQHLTKPKRLFSKQKYPN